jgi:hypothetical protein
MVLRFTGTRTIPSAYHEIVSTYCVMFNDVQVGFSEIVTSPGKAEYDTEGNRCSDIHQYNDNRIPSGCTRYYSVRYTDVYIAGY